jgi:AcrR family transcriptional regulator
MARDGAPTRRRILEAATRLLRTRGIDAFAIEAVARGAGVAKGLVIYHFGSRAELLRECGAAVQADRVERLRQARATDSGSAVSTPAWEEPGGRRRTGRRARGSSQPAAPAPRPDPDAAAGAGVLDGCALALAAGVTEASVREAHDALWLALLQVLEEPE